MPVRQRTELADALAHELWRDVLDAREKDAFTAEDVHLRRTMLVLDDQGPAARRPARATVRARGAGTA